MSTMNFVNPTNIVIKQNPPTPVAMEAAGDVHKVTEEIVSITNVNEDRERKVFMQDLNKFMSEIGKPLSKIPIMGYKELDLFQLYREVIAYGGFNEVVKNVGTWSKIWKRLGNFDPSITDSSFRLKKNYERYLLEYEYRVHPDHRQQAGDADKSLKKSQGDTSASAAIKDKTKAKKQIKRKAGVSTKDIPRDKNGMPKMPLILGELVVENLGMIIPRSPYVSEKHIYPVGFVSSRTFSSMRNPEIRVKYTSKIVDGGDKPQFIVIAADDEANPIISHSPSGAWRTVLKRVADKIGSEESRKHISVSGTLRFGLAHPVVSSLIRELPGIEKVREVFGINGELGESPTKSRKRKTVTSSSSDESGEDSMDLMPSPPLVAAPPATTMKVVRTSSANDIKSEIRAEIEDYYSARHVHFSTREEVDDLESAVATLYSLKHCGTHTPTPSSIVQFIKLTMLQTPLYDSVI